jgi:hypothetical protein
VSVRTLVIVAASSALIGGVAGAGVALWAAPGSAKKPSKSASSVSAEPAAANDTPLEERVANVEQAVRVLERRGASPLRVLPTLDGGSAPGAAPGSPPGEAALVDDPVFEAAVRDVIDRAEIDRDAEREVRREDRRKQMASSWADDMTTKLRLNEQQKAKVLDIAQKFMSEISRIWEQRDGGAGRSRSERRAEIQALQQQSEQALRGVLDPGQARAYDALDEDDKLGFPRRRGGGDRGDPSRGGR